MKSLWKKADGQMIILAGFFVGVAIVALTILLNQIILSGYQVSRSELDDTKYSLSSLREETIRTIKRAAYESWKNANRDNNTANLSAVESAFNLYMANFSSQIPGIYRQYGKIVNVSKFNILSSDSQSYINNVSFEMTYTDGVNSYYATVFLENIRLTTGVYGNEKGTKARRVLIAFLDPMVVNSSGGIPESVTNLTVRITDEIGNPIPSGYEIPVNFTIVKDPSGEPAAFLNESHGYLSLSPYPITPLLNYSALPDGNGQINIFYFHNCGGNDNEPKKAVLVETAPDTVWGPVPPVYVVVMGEP